MGELSNNEAIIFVQNNVEGDVVVCNEGVSFWGGVELHLYLEKMKIS